MTTQYYVGAIGQGTAGTRSVLFDRSGTVRDHACDHHDRYCPVLAVGYRESLEELRENRRTERVFDPERVAAAADRDGRRWLAAGERSPLWRPDG